MNPQATEALELFLRTVAGAGSYPLQVTPGQAVDTLPKQQAWRLHGLVTRLMAGAYPAQLTAFAEELLPLARWLAALQPASRSLPEEASRLELLWACEQAQVVSWTLDLILSCLQAPAGTKLSSRLRAQLLPAMRAVFTAVPELLGSLAERVQTASPAQLGGLPRSFYEARLTAGGGVMVQVASLALVCAAGQPRLGPVGCPADQVPDIYLLSRAAAVASSSRRPPPLQQQRDQQLVAAMLTPEVVQAYAREAQRYLTAPSLKSLEGEKVADKTAPMSVHLHYVFLLAALVPPGSASWEAVLAALGWRSLSPALAMEARLFGSAVMEAVTSENSWRQHSPGLALNHFAAVWGNESPGVCLAAIALAAAAAVPIWQAAGQRQQMQQASEAAAAEGMHPHSPAALAQWAALNMMHGEMHGEPFGPWSVLGAASCVVLHRHMCLLALDPPPADAAPLAVLQLRLRTAEAGMQLLGAACDAAAEAGQQPAPLTRGNELGMVWWWAGVSQLLQEVTTTLWVRSQQLQQAGGGPDNLLRAAMGPADRAPPLPGEVCGVRAWLALPPLQRFRLMETVVRLLGKLRHVQPLLAALSKPENSFSSGGGRSAGGSTSTAGTSAGSGGSQKDIAEQLLVWLAGLGNLWQPAPPPAAPLASPPSPEEATAACNLLLSCSKLVQAAVRQGGAAILATSSPRRAPCYELTLFLSGVVGVCSPLLPHPLGAMQDHLGYVSAAAPSLRDATALPLAAALRALAEAELEGEPPLQRMLCSHHLASALSTLVTLAARSTVKLLLHLPGSMLEADLVAALKRALVVGAGTDAPAAASLMRASVDCLKVLAQQPCCYGAVKQQHSASASYGWQGGGRRSAPRRQGTNGRRTLPSVHTTNPADYGWVLQGTDERARVEYWAWAQDPSVKIDYYPTTGTVKTMLDHPSQGRTQMFRRNLSEDGFIRVLLNPRAHTGKGYQRRHTGGYGR
ncbi:hypothetical protein ABPG75_009685 [Micractinium tetrahymenae]